MSTLDQLFEDIDQEAQEKKLQKYINFAHKQKYSYPRFKKLIDLNLRLTEGSKWEEERYIQEYHQFVTRMFEYRWSFNTQKYFNSRYDVPLDSFIPVHEDLTVGKKRYSAHANN